MNGDSTTSLINLFQCLNTLSVKKDFLLSNLNITRHSSMLCPLVLSLVTWEKRPTHPCLQLLLRPQNAQRSTQTRFPSVLESTAAHWQSWWASDHRAGQPGFAVRAGSGSTPASLRPEGTRSSRGSLGTQAAERGGRVHRGMLPAPIPEASRRVPPAAEGAGRAAGRALPKGLRRARDGDGRQRSLPPFPPPRGWSLPWAAPPAPPRSVTPVEPLLPFPLAGAGAVSCPTSAAPPALGPIRPGPGTRG